MDCDLCTSNKRNPYCPMCRDQTHIDPDIDDFLINSLKTYLKQKQPGQTEEILVKMAEHLASIVQVELGNFE